MEKITFYSITPLFRFELNPDTSVFSYDGVYKDTEYKIKIVKPEQGPNCFDVLMPWADEKTRKSCEQIHLAPNIIGGAAVFFLTIDVTREYTDKLKAAYNTKEGSEIIRAVFDALRLVSSKGLLYYNTYNFRSIPLPGGGTGISSPSTEQYFFSHLGKPSVLQEAMFATCKSIFQTLLHGLHNSDNDSNKPLKIPLEYHEVVFKLGKVEHSFLILMIIFESMFKEDGEKRIANASRRIGNYLGNTEAEKDVIRKEFDSNVKSTFGKIRNDIAHGDSSLDIQIVKDKYPVLYGYITRAIIKHIEDSKK